MTNFAVFHGEKYLGSVINSPVPPGHKRHFQTEVGVACGNRRALYMGNLTKKKGQVTCKACKHRLAMWRKQ